MIPQRRRRRRWADEARNIGLGMFASHSPPTPPPSPPSPPAPPSPIPKPVGVVCTSLNRPAPPCTWSGAGSGARKSPWSTLQASPWAISSTGVRPPRIGIAVSSAAIGIGILKEILDLVRLRSKRAVVSPAILASVGGWFLGADVCVHGWKLDLPIEGRGVVRDSDRACHLENP